MGRIKPVDRHEHDVLRALVRDWRAKAGLTQRELSAKLERPHNYMVKVENGAKGVEVVDFIDIIRALDRDVPRSLQAYGEQLDKKLKG